MLKKFKEIFKIVNYFGTMILQDGTEVTVDGKGDEGDAVTVVIEGNNEPVPLPDGEYTLEDGMIMTVAAGVIVDIVEPTPEEEEAPEEAPEEEEEVEAQEVVETPEGEEVTVPTEEEVAEVVEDVQTIEDVVALLEERVATLENMLAGTEEMKSEFQSLKEKLEKTDGAFKVSKIKKEVELSPSEKRYQAIKNRIVS